LSREDGYVKLPVVLANFLKKKKKKEGKKSFRMQVVFLLIIYLNYFITVLVIWSIR